MYVRRSLPVLHLLNLYLHHALHGSQSATKAESHQAQAHHFRQKMWSLLQSDPVKVLTPLGLGAFLAIALQLLLIRFDGRRQQKEEVQNGKAGATTEKTKANSKKKQS